MRCTEVKANTGKVAANTVFSILASVGRAVHAVLKCVNDPTMASETANIFVPKAVYNAYLVHALGNVDSQSFKLGSAIIHRFGDKTKLAKLLDAEYLEATWGEIKTSVVVTIMQYPFNVRYPEASEKLKCIFGTQTQHPDGRMFIAYDQNLKQ